MQLHNRGCYRSQLGKQHQRLFFGQAVTFAGRGFVGRVKASALLIYG